MFVNPIFIIIKQKIRIEKWFLVKKIFVRVIFIINDKKLTIFFIFFITKIFKKSVNHTSTYITFNQLLCMCSYIQKRTKTIVDRICFVNVSMDFLLFLKKKNDCFPILKMIEHRFNQIFFFETTFFILNNIKHKYADPI